MLLLIVTTRLGVYWYLTTFSRSVSPFVTADRHNQAGCLLVFGDCF